MSESPSLRRWRAERRVLLAVLEYVERHRDPRLHAIEISELSVVFADQDALLTALTMRWSRPLEAHLDTVLDVPHPERDAAADQVVADLSAREPTLHAVLRHYYDRPVVARARARDLNRAGLVRANVHGEHVTPRYCAPELSPTTKPLTDPSVAPQAGKAPLDSGAAPPRSSARRLPR